MRRQGARERDSFVGRRAARWIRELYRGPENVTSLAFAARAALSALRASPRRADADAAPSLVRRWNLERRGSHGPAAALSRFGRPLGVIWSAIEAPDSGGVLTVGGNGAVLWDPLHPKRRS